MAGMIRVAVLGVLACALGVAAPITYTESGGPLADYDVDLDIPGVTTFSLTVPDGGVIAAGSGNVILRLLGFEHTWAGDLEVVLTHEPTGVSRTVFSRIGDPGDPASSDFGDNYSFGSLFTGDLWAVALALGDIDVIPGDSVLPPQTYYPTNAGSSSPNDFNTAFAGITPTGVWRLTITDYNPEDTGSLLGWELTLDIDPVLIPEPATFWMAGPVAAALLAGARRRRRRA